MTIRDTIGQAMRDIIKSATSLADGKVIFAEQNGVIGPRPAKPYITVKVGAIPDDGLDEIQDKWTSGATLVRYQRGARRASISVQGFGTGTDDYLELVRTGLQNNAIRAIMLSTGCQFQNPGTILNLTDMLDSSFEQRFSLDMDCYYIQSNTANVDTAVTITTSGTLYDATDHIHISTIVTP